MAQHDSDPHAARRERLEEEASRRDRAAGEATDPEERARRIWEQMEVQRDRAELMGDRVEDGTRETATGSRSAKERAEREE